jgi:hypothetical protein
MTTPRANVTSPQQLAKTQISSEKRTLDEGKSENELNISIFSQFFSLIFHHLNNFIPNKIEFNIYFDINL